MDVSQYLDIFIDETNEHLQALSDNIMILEKEPENSDTVNEIFRAAHSLKGMAGTMGFKRMQHLTHDMENLFQEVRNDTIKVNSELIDIMFQCLDAIEGYLDTVKETSNEGTEDNSVLIKKINAFLEGGGSDGAEDDASAGGDAADAGEQGKEDDANSAEQFKNIVLEEEERAKLSEAAESGLNLFGFTVHIQEDCLLKAARAFLAFKAMEDFGDIIVYRPNSQDIEDEKFELTFNTIMSSDNDDVGPIKEAVLAVSEIESVEADKVTMDMYPESKDEAEAAETPSAQQTSAPTSQESAPQEVAVQKTEKKKKTPGKSGGKNNAKKPSNKPVTPRTVRVDIEKLDALMNQVSELIIAKNSLVALSSGDNNGTGGGADNSQFFHEQIEYLERVATSLHESVMQVRMVPIETTVNKFPRMIRDLSRKLNKPMELVMTGEETELDRTVVDQIGDPLQHLLRNSADHGIESVEERKKNGKPETGNIFLNAFQEGNNVIIQVGDDGGGINTDAVLSKAIERGLVSEDEAETLSQKEIIDFLFMPSFSMAKQITDISGRGVGLDVVKSNIEALGGDVEVKSVMGQGSTFTVRLPLTLAIIQALMVEVRTEKYAIALASIMTIETIPVAEIKYVEAKEVIHLRGMVIPLVRLDEILDSEPQEEEEKDLTVVVVKKGDSAAGLVVDNLMGQQEIVIKSIGKVIENNKIISGATILGDGEVALILDVNALF